jgi:hypothetical protein
MLAIRCSSVKEQSFAGDGFPSMSIMPIVAAPFAPTRAPAFVPIKLFAAKWQAMRYGGEERSGEKEW